MKKNKTKKGQPINNPETLVGISVTLPQTAKVGCTKGSMDSLLVTANPTVLL